ncbi:AAA family ATPase [Sorangium sp. So ce1504]|uniref:serine/threonine-protein kinase n=1 Tax=Sorangium sp. So ce1504 TaxID=3133337 RepID=UPI003F6290A6
MDSVADGPAAEGFGGTDRFEIRARLGAGGMGVVYHAHDRLRCADVALKTLLRMEAADILRLKSEFRAIADIAHPNLVTLYELISAQGRWFFTMELVSGVNFTRYVRGGEAAAPGSPAHVPERTSPAAATTCQVNLHGRAPSPRADGAAPTASGGEPASQPKVDVARLCQALEQLVHAVEALHGAGKLHLDLKPSNVLVDQSGRVVVLDFGIARDTGARRTALATAETDAPIAGTPIYMAPEHMRGELSAAADWYAVGVILYESLTGRAPFSGNLFDIVEAKAFGEPPPPHLIAPDAPRALSDLCLQLLQRDPRARATGADALRVLREAAVALAAAPGAAPRPGAPPPGGEAPTPLPRAPFMGRGEPLRALQEAFDEARAGRPVAVYVHGRSGMGKSALVQHFLDDLRGRRAAVVLAGRCYERESVPFKAFDSALDALSRHLKRLPRSEAAGLLPRGIHELVRVFPALRVVAAIEDVPRRAFEIHDAQELRFRAFRALKELLSALADKGPLVVSIDDLQWGDRDSALLLADLLGPPDPPSMLMLGVYRSEDEASSPFLRELFGAPAPRWTGGTEHRKLCLGPLVREEAESLARSLLGGHGPSHKASEIARESEGSPFFLTELALHLGRAAPVHPGHEDACSPAPPVSLEALLLARFADLPADARRLLEVIAVAGLPIEQRVALRAAGLQGDAAPALHALRTWHLVRTGGLEEADPVEAYHDRVREAASGQIEPSRLKDHHRRLGEELAALGRADPEQIARHFHGAGDLDRAGAYAAEAADRAAAALAFENAARLYQLSLDCAPAGSDRRHGLLVQLGHALANAGRGADAARAYLGAADAARGAAAPSVVLDCKRLAAEQLLTSGHTEEGVAVLREVLSETGLRYPETKRRALAAALVHRTRLALRGFGFKERDASQIDPAELRRVDVCFSAFLGLCAVDPVRAVGFHAQHILLALAAREPGRVALGLAFMALFASIIGKPAGSSVERAIAAVTPLLQRSGDARVEGVLRIQRAIAAHETSFRETVMHAEEAERIFRERCTGVAWEIGTAQTICMIGLGKLGDLRRLAQRLSTWIKEAEARGDRYAVTSLRTVTGGHSLVALAADDPARARADLAEALAAWRQQGFQLQHFFGLFADVLIDLYCEDPGAAWRRLTAAWPAVEDSTYLRMSPMRIGAIELRGRAALDAVASAADPAPLLRIAERVAGVLLRERVGWASAQAWLTLAAVAWTRGDAALARTHLEAAIAGFDASEVALSAAAARRRLGEVLGGDEGRALVRTADDAMVRLGASRPDRMTALFAPGFGGR